jgi:hypothetical protein
MQEVAMNFTIGLPEIALGSSTWLYVSNYSVMGHVFVGLCIFFAFGRLATRLHFIEQEKKTFVNSNKT